MKQLKNNKRKRFLYISGNIEDGVGYELWKGILTKTKKSNIDLICLTGGRLGEDNRSLVYNLINVDTIDGFISHAGSNIDMFIPFYDKFKDHPFVALSVPVPEFPVVLVNSYQGMRNVVEHLINVHSYTKIALVRGRKNHGYAIQRYEAYLDVVKENKIYNENLITPPLNFYAEDGVKGIEILLDMRNLKPQKDIEAIVFVSDNPAIGALNELKSRNIIVPDQIAITGCNAAPEALYANAPITTITMPFREQSYRAIDLLLQLLNSEDVPMKTVIPAKLLVAQSCGCQSPGIQTAVIDLKKNNQIKNTQNKLSLPGKYQNDTAIVSRKIIEKQIITEINEYSQSNDINEPILSDYVGNLLTAFYDDLENNNQGAFFLCFNQLINYLVDNNIEIDFLQDIISIYRRNLNKDIKKIATIQIVEQIWSQARILVTETSSRVLENETLIRKKQETTLRSVSAQLITTYNINILLDILVDNLPKLDIPGCYISLYEKPEDITSLFDVPEKARLIFAYENGKRQNISKEGILFQSKNLLPEEFITKSERRTIVVQSLNFNDIQMGFIQFELGPEDSSIYTILSSSLSCAIKGAFLLNETLQNSEQLSKAYRNLQKNQKKLLLAEKMASLGRLTAGIAHEMNTPVAVIQDTMEKLKVLVTEYQDSISNPNVPVDDHREIVKKMADCIDLSIQSARKSCSFIKGLKGQTVSMDEKSAEIFIANHAIVNALNFLEFTHSRNQIISEIDDTIELFGNPRALSQIVTDLINNAVEASDGKEVITTVTLKRIKSSHARLTVEDNGPGIPEEDLPRIFDPFFTTKPSGNSSGLSLSIVKDLVDQFKGTITVKSNNGITQFSIELPLADHND